MTNYVSTATSSLSFYWFCKVVNSYSIIFHLLPTCSCTFHIRVCVCLVDNIVFPIIIMVIYIYRSSTCRGWWKDRTDIHNLSINNLYKNMYKYFIIITISQVKYSKIHQQFLWMPRRLPSLSPSPPSRPSQFMVRLINSMCLMNSR